DAMHTPIGAADRERKGGRIVAAAIAGDHHGRTLEHRAGAFIAVQLRELADRLVQKFGEYARLPEPPARGIERVDRELRRDQDGVQAGLLDLAWNLLPVANIARERG